MKINNYIWENDLSLNDLVLKQKEEIERLNSIINNDFSKICREKMIDKLSANEMILLQDKEIERLNNIINELEKWLEEQHQFIIEIPAYTKEIAVEHKTMETCYENVLDKLQELKGDDKE